jgi:hypothetical protein
MIKQKLNQSRHSPEESRNCKSLHLTHTHTHTHTYSHTHIHTHTHTHTNVFEYNLLIRFFMDRISRAQKGGPMFPTYRITEVFHFPFSVFYHSLFRRVLVWTVCFLPQPSPLEIKVLSSTKT